MRIDIVFDVKISIITEVISKHPPLTIQTTLAVETWAS